MKIYQAVILGAVQGLTEFLPVSSSGHLVLLQKLFGIDTDCSLFLTVMLHVGTLVPVFIVFWKQIVGLFKKPFKKLLLLVLASVPAALAGFLLGDFLDRAFYGGKYLIPCFVFTAVLLYAAELYSKRRPMLKPVGVKTSVVMGLAQAVAVVPGISRSGTVISAGCFCGADRTENADFAFLMSIPVILGSALVEGVKAVKTGFGGIGVMPLLFGVLSAAVFGYVAVKLMLSVIKKANYKWFSVYLVLLSAVMAIIQAV